FGWWLRLRTVCAVGWFGRRHHDRARPFRSKAAAGLHADTRNGRQGDHFAPSRSRAATLVSEMVVADHGTRYARPADSSSTTERLRRWPKAARVLQAPPPA